MAAGTPSTRSGGPLDPELSEFDRIFRTYFPRLTGYFYRRADPSDAEDLVVEVFTVLWRRRHEVRPKSEVAWIFGIARGILQNYFRSQKRQDALAARIAELSTNETFADPASELADRLAMLEALDKLSEQDRELIILSAWDDLSLPDIARVVGCSVGAARVRLYRARRSLQRTLGPDIGTVNAVSNDGSST